MKNKAVLLQAEDWEMLYINGQLKRENHELNEGEDRITYFFDLVDKYDFDLKEMKIVSMEDVDLEELDEYGSAKECLTDWAGDYE